MGWVEAGDAVRAERLAQHWRRPEDFAARCGISARTLRALERGERENFSDTTLTPIEAMLGWAQGSIRRMALKNQAPQRVPDVDLLRIERAWAHLTPNERRAVANLAEQLAE